MHYLIALSFLACTCGTAVAQDTPARATDFEKQALAYELQECVGAKIRANAQVLSLQSQLSAASKRADEAEAKLKAKDDPKD